MSSKAKAPKARTSSDPKAQTPRQAELFEARALFADGNNLAARRKALSALAAAPAEKDAELNVEGELRELVAATRVEPKQALIGAGVGVLWLLWLLIFIVF